MTHDDLLMLVTGGTNYTMAEEHLLYRKALCAVVELHKPEDKLFDGSLICEECTQGAFARLTSWPCPTIQAIEKELL